MHVTLPKHLAQMCIFYALQDVQACGINLPRKLSVCAQGRSPEFVLQIMKTADRLPVNMPKTLACCERHIAIAASSIRTEAFWELIPVRSSVRIARGLDAAYKNLKILFVSKIDSLLDALETTLAKPHTPDTIYHVRACKLSADSFIDGIELALAVPSCKAFLDLAESVPSQATAVSYS